MVAQSTWRLLRFPVVFGSCLGAYFLAFSYRKIYFNDEIEEVRERNQLQAEENREKLEKAEAARKEAKLMRQQSVQKS